MSAEAFAIYDESFNPESDVKSGFGPQTESLKDGEYVLKIVSASASSVTAKESNSTTPVTRWKFLVQAGPSHVGQNFDHTGWVQNEAQCNALGADLKALGIPVETWRAEGVKFSQRLDEALESLSGVTMAAKKDSHSSKGRTYHNLRFKGLRPSGVTVQPGEAAAPSGTQSKAFEMNDLPF
jgi:hypothetical protein